METKKPELRVVKTLEDIKAHETLLSDVMDALFANAREYITKSTPSFRIEGLSEEEQQALQKTMFLLPLAMNLAGDVRHFLKNDSIVSKLVETFPKANIPGMVNSLLARAYERNTTYAVSLAEKIYNEVLN